MPKKTPQPKRYNYEALDDRYDIYLIHEDLSTRSVMSVYFYVSHADRVVCFLTNALNEALDQDKNIMELLTSTNNATQHNQARIAYLEQQVRELSHVVRHLHLHIRENTRPCRVLLDDGMPCTVEALPGQKLCKDHLNQALEATDQQFILTKGPKHD